MLRLTHPLAASAIVTTLLGAVVFACPSFAASGDLLIAQATPSEETSATAPESEKGESQLLLPAGAGLLPATTVGGYQPLLRPLADLPQARQSSRGKIRLLA